MIFYLKITSIDFHGISNLMYRLVLSGNYFLIYLILPLTVCLCSCGWFLLSVISLQYCWTLVVDGVCCSPPVLCILLAMLLK